MPRPKKKKRKPQTITTETKYFILPPAEAPEANAVSNHGRVSTAHLHAVHSKRAHFSCFLHRQHLQAPSSTLPYSISLFSVMHPLL